MRCIEKTCILILLLIFFQEGKILGQGREFYAININNNYVYLGVSNPIKIGVTGIPESSLHVRTSVGELRKLNNKYYWEICDSSFEMAFIYVEGVGEFSEFRDSTLFRIKKLPNPRAKLVAKEHVPPKGFENYFGLIAWFEEFEYDIRCEIISYKVRILRKDRVIGVGMNMGETFADPVREMLKGLEQGDILEFYQIECRCPCDQGSGKRELDSIKYEIN